MTNPSTDRSGTIEAGPISPASISVPGSVRYHAVDDAELERLMKFERPLIFAVATIFAGIFFGTAYQMFEVVQSARHGAAQISLFDLLYVIACAGSFGVALVAAICSARGRSEVVKAVKEIRERSKVTLPAGHPAAPRGKKT